MPSSVSLLTRRARWSLLLTSLLALSACAERPEAPAEPDESSVQEGPSEQAAPAPEAKVAPEPAALPVGEVDVSSVPFDIGAIIERAHFAWRPVEDAEGRFSGGHASYGVELEGGALTFTAWAPKPGAGDADDVAGPLAVGGLELLDPVAAHELPAMPEMFSAAPVRIETVSVGRGAVQMEPGVTATRVTDAGQLVVERALSGAAFTEQFQNRDEGVEQRWHFEAEPAGDGDLEVRVAVSGQRYRATTEGGIHFVDDAAESELGVRYGHATWIDADGVETAVRAAWDADLGEIVLVVDAALVERSAFPAVLDPVVGPETLLNTDVALPQGGAQDRPSVASDGTRFLVVWHDYRASNSDIYGASVAADGSVSASFVIADAPRDQNDPCVGSDGSQFLVAWRDYRSGSNYDIYGARVASDGTVSADFVISNAANAQQVPSVASDGNQFLVVWHDNRSGSSDDIYGARVASDGTVSPASLISGASGHQQYPSVASAGGQFLVAWQDDRSGAWDIYGALVAGDGTASAGFLISDATHHQYEPSVGSDGSQFLVAWQDLRSGSNYDIYGARVASDGTVSSEIVVASAAGNQQQTSVVGRAGGQFLVAWQDERSGNYDIYGARVAGDGTVSPASVISGATGHQRHPTVASDGSQFLVAWQDAASTDVYASRVASDGAVTDTDALHLTTGGNERRAHVASDGSQFLVAWQDYRSGNFDIYGVRVASDTTVSPAFVISNAAGSQQVPSVASDGSQFLVVWYDDRSGNYDIFGARVASDGTVSAETVISAAANAQLYPSVASDNSQFLVVWQDYRSGSNDDIYGARVASDGTVSADFVISNAVNSQHRPTVASDGSQFLVAWYDYRSGSSYDIYGARVASDGMVSADFVISNAANAQQVPSVASDGSQFLVVWHDDRGGNFDIYGSRVASDGTVSPASVISGATGHQRHPTVASDGSQFLVAWQDDRTGSSDDLYGVIVASDGTVASPNGFVISGENATEQYPAMAYAGGLALVVYESRYRAFGRFISGQSPPVATSASVSTTEDAPVDIILTGTDDDGDPLTFALVSGPARGTLSAFDVNTGAVTYTPNPGVTGTDSFEFTVDDGAETSAPATISILIEPDADRDRVADVDDNCPNDANPDQRNDDGDTLGNACDNCPDDTNQDQADFESDGLGDVCDTDDDNDGADGLFDGGGDCNDNDATINPGADELCDGVDNDCSTATADGADEPTLAVACDNTLDPDTCQEGTVVCQAGALSCNDPGSPACDDGYPCATGADCNSQVCTAGTCQTAVCGDNVVNATGEQCDDGNTTTERCTYGQTSCVVCAANCTSQPGATSYCGDGLRDVAHGETCDDGDADGGDGCSSTCSVEPNFVCTGTPSVCRPDGDSDAVADADDNCPTVPNAAQTDGDADGFGDVCDRSPVASGDTYTVDEDTTLTTAAPGVLGNDSDADGNTLTAVLVADVTTGSLALSAYGSFTYTPPTDFVGQVTFTYQATDGSQGNNLSNTATVTIDVTNINDAPVLTNVDGAPATATEDVTYGYDFDAIDIDAGATLSWALTSDDDCESAAIDNQGVYTFTETGPVAPTSCTLGLEVCDADGACDTFTQVITMAPNNDAPSITSSIAPTATEDIAYTFTATGVDPEGTTLTWDTTATDDCPSSLIDSASGVYTFDTSGPTPPTSCTVSIELCDAGGSCVTQTGAVTLTEVNDSPIAALDGFTVAEDAGSTGLDVLANDSDPDEDTLTVTSTTQPANGAVIVALDGTAVSYAPDPDFHGVDAFDVTVSDGRGGTDTATVTVTVTSVNDVPVAIDDPATTDEDTPVAIDVLANDTDVDSGDTKTLVSVTAPANGAAVVDGSGGVTYTPDADFNGTDTFDYTMQDTAGVTATATVTVTVTPVNDGPTITDIGDQTTDEDTATGELGFVIADLDDAPSTLTVTASSSDEAIVSASGISLSGSGADRTIALTPEAEASGSTTITVTVSDGALDASDTFVLVVVPIDDPPVATADTYATDEDTALTVDAASGVLANDSDAEGQALTAVLDTDVTHGTLTLNADGSFEYVPDAEFNGQDTLTYHVTDGTQDSGLATVTIDVGNINDAPVFDDPGTLGLTDAETLDVMLTASDLDGDPLTFTSPDLPAGATLAAGGRLTWSPTWRDAATHTVTIEVSDGTVTTSATLTLVVTYVDGDADALPDAWEVDLGLDPTTLDSDGDFIDDTTEVYGVTGTGTLDAPLDTDSDLTLDALDLDSDEDGIADLEESGDGDLLTAPVDTDGDDVPDYVDADSDDDTVDDGADNCRLVQNADQLDTDGDLIGDVCDDDSDGDGLSDADEATLGTDPLRVDSDGDTIDDATEVGADVTMPLDTDTDGTIDALDEDADDDGVPDADEAGDADLTSAPHDTDNDGAADYVDTDSDDDTVTDDADNCRLVANTDQLDTDDDGTGDACVDDVDGDTVLDADDNCPFVANPGQTDLDLDGLGDACDSDIDGDSVDNASDNCFLVANADQVDSDSDNAGDACDDDDDNDQVLDADDNCPLIANPDQLDSNDNGRGDLCESVESCADGLDNDGDGDIDCDDVDCAGESVCSPVADGDVFVMDRDDTSNGGDNDADIMDGDDLMMEYPVLEPIDRNDDEGCCTTVRASRRSHTPWPLALGLIAMLLGLVAVRRRR